MSWLTRRMQRGHPVASDAGVPAGGMKLITINDATPIDPVVTTAGPNIGSPVGASGSGWVAVVVLKGLTSLVGTCVPSSLTLSVSDPGYDTSGNVTTVNRTITGVAQLRRQYPSGASKMISTDGTDLTIYITLDDWIYTGTTIVSATIGGTFYTGCTAGNTGAAYSNLSATAYPKALFGWLNDQEDVATGNTYPVEAVAFHRHAQGSQQVACVKYTATDGTNFGTTSTVSAPTLSTKMTQGNIPEVWAASVDFSTLNVTNGSTFCTVNAKVYPWIGDSSAVLDLSIHGVAWPTSLPITPLRIVNDRTLAYGGAFAYVLVGAGGSPQVSKTAATARANPYATVTAAMNAIKVFNTANGISHNDHGGATVRLMDNAGAAQTHTIASGTTQPAAPASTYCTVEPDPLNTGAISVTFSAQSAYPDMMRWRNFTLVSNAGTTRNFIGQNNARSKLSIDGITYDATANGMDGATWYSMKYTRNITLVGGRSLEFNGIPNATCNIALMAGWVSSTLTSQVNNADQAKLVIGCTMPNYLLQAETSGTGDGDDGRIIYNNKFLRALVVNATQKTFSYGLANVQNQWEHDTAADAAVMSMNFFADGDLTSLLNYIEFNNTAVGNRCSRMYNDTVSNKIAPTGNLKQGRSCFNIWDDYNIKSDTYTSGQGSVGNFAYMYSVGNVGNVSLFGAVNRGPTEAPHNDNVDTPFLGNAWLPSSNPNLQLASGANLTQAQIMALFVNYTVAPQASVARGGNYTPLSTSALLKSRVPIGKGVLLRDLAGTLRRTDGTGAAGAYESL